MNFKNPDIEIIKNKKLFIFDMDGTIYLGGVPFEFAKRFIKNLRSSGKKVLFFTNNASHTSCFYFNKLAKLGFEPQEDEIMTSGDVTREFLLAYRKEKSVYMVATDELVEEYGITTESIGFEDMINDYIAAYGENAGYILYDDLVDNEVWATADSLYSTIEFPNHPFENNSDGIRRYVLLIAGAGSAETSSSYQLPFSVSGESITGIRAISANGISWDYSNSCFWIPNNFTQTWTFQILHTGVLTWKNATAVNQGGTTWNITIS